MDGTTPDLNPGAAASRTPIPELSLPELADRITELAGHLNAANHRWLVLIAEFDRRQGWHDGALRSCAHWLNFKCGIDLGAAREKLRVARALEALPAISAAMGRGELSYSKVRALTRVAEPANEDYFLSIALHGTAHHVEKLVRHYRHCLEAEALSREASQMALRHLNFYYETDGSVVIRGRMPAQAGELLIKAIEAATDQLPPSDLDVDSDVDAGLRDAPERWQRPHSTAVRRADALALVAESFLARAGAADAAAAAGGNLADRYQVVVHVDAQTLRHRGAGRCEFEQGGSLPVESLRRIACDAGIVGLIEGAGGEVMDVGRKTRAIPPAIRRALKARDKGCRFPGCTHERWVDAHHIDHWADGGATALSNLLLLCRFHHRLVHEGGVVIQTLDDGALRFVRPDGRSFEEHPARRREYCWSDLVESHGEAGLDIDADTAATQWRGERMDYQMALDVLLQQRDVAAAGGVAAAGDVAAET